MEFRLLGPVELHTTAGSVDLGTPRERYVLAVLAADAGRLVPIGTLIERVWGPDAPAGARATLRVYLAHIRKVLDKANADSDRPAAVVRRPGCYLLDVDADQVDLHRFRQLVARARDAEGGDQRAALLREALDLPGGEPLADLSGDWAERIRSAWSREYLDTVLAWARAALGLGEGRSAVGLLAELTDRHPLNESLAAALMRALHAAGRGSEALKHYADVQARLVDELGTDPGAELQAVHQDILRETPAQPARRAASPAIVPAQLPPDVASFVGRRQHLDRLDALLTEALETGGATAPVITAIVGSAGVGKTALAVHWAHRVAGRFPDGQLYVNLRGFDPSGQMMDQATAVRRFLDAFHVPPRRVPADPDAQAALYRSMLTGKRMLLVLDNARDSAQVRPLLPGVPGCLAIVTSRNQLTGLIAAHDAHPVALDLLTLDEARQLLARRLGTERVATDPDAVAEIITSCARLPLALTLIAAHAALRPDFALRALADELRDAHHRWQTLTGDDPSTDVRAVFSWSYRALTPDSARLFRLLGLYPGPDLTAPAAASLTAMPIERVRSLLAELTTTNLVIESTPGRYLLHDLLRAYATDLTGTTDTDEQHRAARRRILDHYLHTAYTADRLLHPARDTIVLATPSPGVTPEQATGHQQALDWFTAEHAVLLAGVESAGAAGFDTHAWQLTWTLRTFLDRRGSWHDQVTIGRTAVAAAERLADVEVQALAHRYLAGAYTNLGRFEDAHTHLSQAYDLVTRTGDRNGQAQTHGRLAHLWLRRGDPGRALDHGRRALDLFRTLDDRLGQARALSAVGWYHAQLGEHRQALDACQEALALQQELGNRYGEGATWDSLGYAHHHLGHRSEAFTCYERAVAVFRALSDRFLEADTLTRLGDAHNDTGDRAAAHDAYRQALTIFDELDHPAAAEVRAKLAEPQVPDRRLVP